MDWRSLTFDWNHARAFLATAEEGSLSAAARALGMAQPTIGRQVAALEQEMNVVLFERAGRGLILTPSGQELRDHLRAMGEAATRFSLAAAGRSQSIAGSIRITASEVYSAHLLPPIIMRLRALHPGIEVEIVASNSRTDLLRREADIAIRNYTSTQPELIVRKVKDDTGAYYATPAYLRSIGEPRTLGEMARGVFLGFAPREAMATALRPLGLDLTPAHFPIISESHLVQWEYVKRGAGIGVITEAVGDAETLVRRVLPDAAPIQFPMFLVTHRELHTSKRVRTVFDLLAAELARPADSTLPHPPAAGSIGFPSGA
ncbi:LysR family transcriptional regulator [Sediminicoccus sp. KRV36]|uniref:LysR family transcriptional regulator n=1 Tax=Sediminicoccus sp. KRV36 TaxID=3133721 RepID=UPI00200FF76A|nr:LysR family transcriptional regulator [Sediminicoccus rosea]UPY37777.1 LysR family transcriptional regulator [Sediminicoccus rosea]